MGTKIQSERSRLNLNKREEVEHIASLIYVLTGSQRGYDIKRLNRARRRLHDLIDY